MFKKASKKQAKLRCAIFGVSGSGKTYSALRIASGMGGKIAVIDTERGSASKYADRFDFDVAELLDHSIDSYIRAIKSAQGYNVLVIDSLTHGWQELLEQIDLLAKSKYKGNTWSAWSDGTPKQKMLVNALLSFEGHIIATMRSKTEWTVTMNSNGKNTPTRVGLTPEQGKGIEYEFDLLLEISEDHCALVLKDRTGKFQDKIITKPSEEFGQELIAWLNEGEESIKKIETSNLTIVSTDKISKLADSKAASLKYDSFIEEMQTAKTGEEVLKIYNKACETFRHSRTLSEECVEQEIIPALTKLKDFLCPSEDVNQ